MSSSARMRPSDIVKGLRDQFGRHGHLLRVGDPKSGDDAGAIYEIYPGGDSILFARCDSSADAEAIVTAINAACGRAGNGAEGANG